MLGGQVKMHIGMQSLAYDELNQLNQPSVVSVLSVLSVLSVFWSRLSVVFLFSVYVYV